ncbi:DNA polymerase I [Prevotella sp. E13-27]|uniref:DNA polymerase I n=1 Tax=Prevotella sp. E13-27 TaxID=2938122 RepID=UPI00200B609A|nr:DNA polymerase I [Prevotella sp. E13-27]MCK8621628.1 DNA polymerase I [Prevotella sp. E13-27]
MNKLFLLDAYALIYRSYYAFIKNPRINSKGLNTSAIIGFVNTLQEVLEKEKPTHIGVAFDPHGPTFRSEAYPAYKAQREATPEDIRRAIPIIKELLEAYRISVIQVDGFEADDVIGTLATKLSDEKDLEVFMLTPDKDYGQLVSDNVKIFRPRHGGGYETMGPAEVCEKYGIEKTAQVIDLLALMGDSADNFPGCPGVGEKTAVKLINEFGSVEQLLQRTSELKGALKTKVESHIDDIKLSYYLATIKTDVPTDITLDSLKLQNPDEEKLDKIFTELEFKSLKDRVLKKVEKKPKPANGELSLFDFFSAESQTEEKNTSFESVKTVAHNYQLIDTEEKMLEIFSIFKTKNILCLDTETTSTSPIDAELVGLSFSVTPHEAFYVPIPANREEALRIVNIFKPLYEDPEILKVGQNIKYDLEVLRNYNIHLSGPMWDTMIAHYLIQPELHHNMDYMAEVYLNYQTVHIDELIGPKGKNQRSMRDLQPSEVYEYACEDADITLQLKEKLEPELKRLECERLFYDIEMPLMPVLAEMEMNGVCLDTASLNETSKAFTDRMNEIERRIYELAGQSFNIASPKQVGEILFDKLKIVEKAKKTKTGQYVTSEEVLMQLKNKHEIVADILEHRGLKKLIGTYIDALPKLINPRTGHIHTSFNQTITATGRLSSSDPNLQNIPIRGEDGKEIRKAFVPEPGCLFFSADYSQIELRVMAHLSQDENMVRVFREGKDLHAATAANIYKKPIEDVTRDERTKSKRANFGIIYGITVFGLAERLDISRDEAKQLIDGYFETFPQVHDYMERSKQMVREKGYATTLFGRRRYLPDINSQNATVRGFAERNAINAPIQGTAADIIKVAMIHIFERFKKEGIRSKMILQVHDELNFSVYPEEKEQVERIVMEEMQAAFPLSVPLIADSGFGQNWLEAH